MVPLCREGLFFKLSTEKLHRYQPSVRTGERGIGSLATGSLRRIGTGRAFQTYMVS